VSELEAMARVAKLLGNMQRIDRDEMVLAKVGRTIAASVLDDADAVDVEPADDRAARWPGAKLEPVMPGLEKRGRPTRARAIASDLLVRHDRDSGELVGDDRHVPAAGMLGGGGTGA
jgi:hypothetical protein